MLVLPEGVEVIGLQRVDDGSDAPKYRYQVTSSGRRAVPHRWVFDEQLTSDQRAALRGIIPDHMLVNTPFCSITKIEREEREDVLRIGRARDRAENLVREQRYARLACAHLAKRRTPPKPVTPPVSAPVPRPAVASCASWLKPRPISSSAPSTSSTSSSAAFAPVTPPVVRAKAPQTPAKRRASPEWDLNRTDESSNED
jgi:hypothetical protein